MNKAKLFACKKSLIKEILTPHVLIKKFSIHISWVLLVL